MSNLHGLAEQDNYADYKLEYLRELAGLLSTKVSNWYERVSEQIEAHKNDNNGTSSISDWLVLGPIMEDPTRIKYQISKVPLFLHIFGAVFCMGCSATFHLFYVHSPHTSSKLARLDYAGISLMIAGSTMSPIYYNYYCEDTHSWRNFYLTAQVLTSGAVFIVSLWDKFDKP